jgi:phage terminase small subunit
MAAKPLTDKQKRFVAEYLIDLNATAAYKRAGYTGKGNAAEAAASRLLRNVKVAEAIQVGQTKIVNKAELTATNVLDELRLLGFSDIGDILDFTGSDATMREASTISESARRTLSSVKVRRYVEGAGDNARTVEVSEFKLWDKISALDKLARHFRLLVDEVRHSGKVEIKVIGVDNFFRKAATVGSAERDGAPTARLE